MNKWLVYLLIILIIAFFIQGGVKNHEISELQGQNFALNSKLQQQIIIANGKVEIRYRDREKIVYKTRYIPVESPNTTISTGTDGKITVTGDTYGSCFAPWIGITYKDQISPILGTRLLYWNRFGVSPYIGNNILGLGIDYRLYSNMAIGICPQVVYFSLFF